jgi:hypothetical protein
MAMNDVRAPPHWLQFANTRRVEETDPVYDLFQDAANIMAALQKAGNKNISLAINCHGNVGMLQLGTGIDINSVFCFQVIQPYVQSIYITACDVASGTSGDAFCKKIATVARAIVFAGEGDQAAGVGTPVQVPAGAVPAYDGVIKQYGKDGSVIYEGNAQDCQALQQGAFSQLPWWQPQ